MNTKSRKQLLLYWVALATFSTTNAFALSNHHHGSNSNNNNCNTRRGLLVEHQDHHHRSNTSTSTISSTVLVSSTNGVLLKSARLAPNKSKSCLYNSPINDTENNDNDNVNKDNNNKNKVSNIRGGSTDTSSSTNKVPPSQPTLQSLIQFAIPCLGLWISGPLLSLVDTASVGLTAKPGQGATQLGSLGPATTFIDGSQYLFAFLNVATTNLYATAMAKYSHDEHEAKKAGDAVVRTAIKIACTCGFFLLALLLTCGRYLLSIYIGAPPKGADVIQHTQILNAATEYVHIRAYSMPTSLLAGVLQAAMLGSRDSVTPLISTAVSTVANCVGDFICVVRLAMATKGAALATLLAQYAGTLAMWGPARRKLFVTQNSSSSSTSTSHKSTNPYKITSKNFLSFAAPVLTLILGKLAAFGVMTHVAAALPGKASLASHQIILSLFFFLSPFLEVISQTAQAFLPQYYIGASDATDTTTNSKSEENVATLYRKEAQILALRLLKLGMLTGVGIACIASSIPRYFPFILTNDPSVQTAVRPLSLPLLLGGILTAPVAVSEGVLLARRELKYLASVYVLSTFLFPFGLFTIKRSGGPVINVWYGFALFQLFRALCFTGKIWGRSLVQSIFSKFGLLSQRRSNETSNVSV
jgi:Na+-driven multidrug efflux pump